MLMRFVHLIIQTQEKAICQVEKPAANETSFHNCFTHSLSKGVSFRANNAPITVDFFRNDLGYEPVDFRNCVLAKYFIYMRY